MPPTTEARAAAPVVVVVADPVGRPNVDLVLAASRTGRGTGAAVRPDRSLVAAPDRGDARPLR